MQNSLEAENKKLIERLSAKLESDVTNHSSKEAQLEQRAMAAHINDL